MYRDLVNRNPDAGGETFYLNMLSNQADAERLNVLNNFNSQDEHPGFRHATTPTC